MAKSVGSLAVALALLAGPAAAQESKCTAAKHSAAGSYARALEACRARAMKKGVAVDPECDAKAREKLVAQFAKAEKKADCVVSDEEDLAAEVAGTFVDDTRAVLEKGAGVCCNLPDTCGWVRDPAHCTAHGGIEGPPGSVCGGGGTCVALPPFGAGCCENANSQPPDLTCSLVSQASCEAVGGEAYVDPAICTTSRCVRYEGAPPN